MVSAIFELEGSTEKSARRILEANGIDWNEDEGSVILRREITLSGKGRVFVNNQPATVSVLRQLAPHLAAVHAQNETILSFDASARLGLLDAFAGTQLDVIEEIFARWKNINSRIAELEHGEQDRLRLLDLWTFQKREIAEAKLLPHEDERLAAEKLVLTNSEKIYTAAINAFDLLYEGEASTSSSLRSAQKHLQELARYEPKFEDAIIALETARISVEDVGVTLRDYAGGIQASPEHLSEVEDRLAAIDRLKRKYGATVEDVIAYGEEVGRKLSEMENKDETLRQLQTDLASVAEEYRHVAREISKARHEAAHRLAKSVESEINDLAMKAHFTIEVTGSDDEKNWSSSGWDEATYFISTNPGEPLRKLEQIASGGELSRVMLALKATVESGAANVSRARKRVSQRTLVFDEIDTGIGGSAAEAVGKKLKRLAKSNQVLCVTHLPQIATFADHHYLIEKKDSAGRTRTTVRKIVGEERTEEVARMLSGARLTDTSRKHAEQMLKANA